MHQLSALIRTPWIPPYDASFIPHTPSRRHPYTRRANSTFNTPNHPHPYPYLYDPNLSFASFPPESSPEPVYDQVDVYSNPSKGKGKASLRSSDRESSVEESPSKRGRERDDRKSNYLRSQTPGPEIGLAKGDKKLGQNSKQRLKGGLDFAA